MATAARSVTVQAPSAAKGTVSRERTQIFSEEHIPEQIRDNRKLRRKLSADEMRPPPIILHSPHPRLAGPISPGEYANPSR